MKLRRPIVRCTEIGPGGAGYFELGKNYEFNVSLQKIYSENEEEYSFPQRFNSIEEWNKNNDREFTSIAEFKEVIFLMTSKEARALLAENQAAYKASMEKRAIAEEMLKAEQEATRIAAEALRLAEEEVKIAETLERWPNLPDGSPILSLGIAPIATTFSAKSSIEDESYLNDKFTDTESLRIYCQELDYNLTIRRLSLQMDGYLGTGFDVVENAWTLFMDPKDKKLKPFNATDPKTRQPGITLMTKKVADLISSIPEVIAIANRAWKIQE